MRRCPASSERVSGPRATIVSRTDRAVWMPGEPIRAPAMGSSWAPVRFTGGTSFLIAADRSVRRSRLGCQDDGDEVRV